MLELIWIYLKDQSIFACSVTDSKCELCGKVQWKYRCPRCNRKTCSLACVKQHKVQTNCNGVRDKTAFVEMKAMTDMHLLSGMMDYLFYLIGKKTDIVPFLWFAKAISNEFDLCSDYRMLEDVDRSIDNHTRDPLRRSGVNKVVNNVSYFYSGCMLLMFILSRSLFYSFLYTLYKCIKSMNDRH